MLYDREDKNKKNRFDFNLFDSLVASEWKTSGCCQKNDSNDKVVGEHAPVRCFRSLLSRWRLLSLYEKESCTFINECNYKPQHRTSTRLRGTTCTEEAQGRSSLWRIPRDLKDTFYYYFMIFSFWWDNQLPGYCTISLAWLSNVPAMKGGMTVTSRQMILSFVSPNLENDSDKGYMNLSETTHYQRLIITLPFSPSGGSNRYESITERTSVQRECCRHSKHGEDLNEIANCFRPPWDSMSIY